MFRTHKARHEFEGNAVIAALPPPLVSVVTPCFNEEGVIERAIESVHAQTIGPIEHIIVDNESADRTPEIVRMRLRAGDVFISAANEGSVALSTNRGIRRATGRYVHILCADDAIPSDFYEKALNTLERTHAPFVFGDLLMERDRQAVYRQVGDPDYARAIRRRMPNMNEPSCVFDRSVFDLVGLYDESYRRATDYDWYLRAMREGVIGAYDDQLSAYSEIAGIAYTEFFSTITEFRDISIKHGRPLPAAYAEWMFRLAKTSVGMAVQRLSTPLYDLLRASYNPNLSRRGVSS